MRLPTPGARNTAMEASDVKRLKGLEDENAKLKKLPAEARLDLSTLREMLA